MNKSTFNLLTRSLLLLAIIFYLILHLVELIVTEAHLLLKLFIDLWIELFLINFVYINFF